MYRFTPDEIDHERAHHQAVIQGADDLDVKRIGHLGFAIGEVQFYGCFRVDWFETHRSLWRESQLRPRSEVPDFGQYRPERTIRSQCELAPVVPVPFRNDPHPTDRIVFIYPSIPADDGGTH